MSEERALVAISELPDDELLTADEAARVLRVSASTVRREMAAGELVWVRIGPSRTFIRAADLRDYIHGRRSTGAGE